MLKTNDYGRIVRALRKSRGENLNDMAQKLDVSIAFLSALEVGKKNIPLFYSDKIADIYGFTDEERKELATAIDLSNNRILIELGDKSDEQKELCLSVARNVKELSDEDIKAILKILNK